MMRRALLTIFLVLTATTCFAAPPPVNPTDALAFARFHSGLVDHNRAAPQLRQIHALR